MCCVFSGQNDYIAKSLTYHTDLQRQKEAIAQLNAQWTSKQDYVRRRNEEVEKAEVSLDEQKKAVERSKVVNQQLRERLEEQLRNATDAQNGLPAPQPKDLGKCAFHGCLAEVGPMNRQQLYSHLAFHARDIDISVRNRGPVKFICPLPKANGHICGELLETSSKVDFGTHLVHKFHANEQQQGDLQVKSGINRKLREQINLLGERTEIAEAEPMYASQPQDAHHNSHLNQPVATQTTLQATLTLPATKGKYPRSKAGQIVDLRRAANQLAPSPSKPSARPLRLPPGSAAEAHEPQSTGGKPNTVLVGGKGKEKATSGDGEQAIINPEQGASGEQPVVSGKLLEQPLKQNPKAVRNWSD